MGQGLGAGGLGTPEWAKDSGVRTRIKGLKGMKDRPGIQGLASTQGERSQGSSIGPGGKEEDRKKE